MESSALVNLRQCDIPTYLIDSELYRSLDWSDPKASITVPKSYLKLNRQVHNLADLQHLLESMRYWGVREIPDSVYPFVLNKRDVLPGLREAVENFQHEMRWLQILIELPASNPMEHATKAGCLEVIKLLLRHGIAFTDKCPLNAVLLNDTETLNLIAKQQKEFFRRQHPHVGKQVTLGTIAAACGHAESYVILRENGCRRGHSTTLRAAENGHLACLQLARKYGCNWDQQLTLAAAIKNHVECLKYAIENGCPHDLDKLLWLCISIENRECFEYLLTCGAQLPTDWYLNCSTHAMFEFAMHHNAPLPAENFTFREATRAKFNTFVTATNATDLTSTEQEWLQTFCVRAQISTNTRGSNTTS